MQFQPQYYMPQNLTAQPVQYNTQFQAAGMPQFQMMGTTSQINGRVVQSPDEITVREIPTDGTLALFPSVDGTCIYGKRWTPDGNITTMRFIPEVQEAQSQQPSQFDIINDRISALFDVVERIEERLPYEIETKR